VTVTVSEICPQGEKLFRQDSPIIIIFCVTTNFGGRGGEVVMVGVVKGVTSLCRELKGWRGSPLWVLDLIRFIYPPRALERWAVWHDSQESMCIAGVCGVPSFRSGSSLGMSCMKIGLVTTFNPH